MKIHESDPSMDRGIRRFRQLEQGFEPYRMKENEKSTLFLGGGQLFADFRSSRRYGT